MIWTAWKNGKQSRGDAGYGFRLSQTDRDKYFDRNLPVIILELPHQNGFLRVEVNTANRSFWEQCCELRAKEIGQWMQSEHHAPWPNRMPPKFHVVPIGKRLFRVKRTI